MGILHQGFGQNNYTHITYSIDKSIFNLITLEFITKADTNLSWELKSENNQNIQFRIFSKNALFYYTQIKLGRFHFLDFNEA